MKPKTRCKISFLSVIVIVVGAVIGPGIFFKNKQIIHNTMSGSNVNVFTTIMCWVIACIGVIAMSLALIEVISTQKGDKGIVGWSERFNKKWVFEGVKGFMLWIMFPVSMVTLPIYAVQDLQDILGITLPWYSVWLIGLAIVLWLSFISFFSLKLGTIHQWIFTIVKFIPVLCVPIVGFINPSHHNLIQAHKTFTQVHGLSGISSGLGILASIPAIFFSYDGFYSVASLKNQMKKPKLLPIALCVAIIIITICFLFISGGILFGSKEGAIGVWDNKTFKICMETFIMFSVFGIVNGYALGSHNMYNEYIKNKNLLSWKFWSKSQTKDIKIGKWKMRGFTPGFNLFLFLTILQFVIFGIIGSFVYNIVDDPALKHYGDKHTQNFYSFVDLLTNWTSLLVFVSISLVILGALINRKTKKIEVKKFKFFIPAGIISLLFTIIPTLYLFLESVVNMTGYNHADITKAVVTFCILVLTLILSYLPFWIKTICLKIKSKKINIK